MIGLLLFPPDSVTYKERCNGCADHYGKGAVHVANHNFITINACVPIYIKHLFIDE
jgi:hypothetical protein